VQLQLEETEFLWQGRFYPHKSKMAWALLQERGFVTFWDAGAPGWCEELGPVGGKKEKSDEVIGMDWNSLN